jgi:endoglucanase Acf2
MAVVLFLVSPVAPELNALTDVQNTWCFDHHMHYIYITFGAKGMLTEL